LMAKGIRGCIESTEGGGLSFKAESCFMAASNGKREVAAPKMGAAGTAGS